MSPDSKVDSYQRAANPKAVARDGEDPPHEDDGSKTGYPVVSRGKQPRGEDPPHEDDGSKVGYPVRSD